MRARKRESARAQNTELRKEREGERARAHNVILQDRAEVRERKRESAHAHNAMLQDRAEVPKHAQESVAVARSLWVQGGLSLVSSQ